ncbi:hypothetical protein WJX84_000011 [Apatococcus fuscideae]|uniref:Peptidyl-prolyl cis-trans isomerase n=1 Tax=Apatococcus fuscideae TaxID=2026836 RepID=A0AAW1TEN1_9CHLO
MTLTSALRALRVSPGRSARWRQSTTDVDIYVHVDDGTRSSDIKFEILPQRLRLSVGAEEILSGSLPERVSIDGCFWEIDRDYEQRVVRITLQKEVMGHESFQNLIEGDDVSGLVVTDHMFLEISINGNVAGRLVVALYGEKVPLTVENFRQLCLGAQDPDDASRTMTYADSPIHRIIPGFMMQGGDITAGNGTGGKSIYGRIFPDEDLTIKHDAPFLLSMANAGPDTNDSQFFITFDAAPWLNGKHTVFGRVEEGMELLTKIEDLGSQDGQPQASIMITSCGLA